MEIAKALSVASGANLRNGKLHSCPRNPHPASKPPTLFDLAPTSTFRLRQCLCILPSPSLATSGACLQVPPVASSTNRIFTGNNFANIMNLVNSFHALRSRSIAVRFGSQHILSSAVVGFCVEQICIPLTSTQLVAK
jgi:hypothetical protein